MAHPTPRPSSRHGALRKAAAAATLASCLAGIAGLHAAGTDLELTTPDGRRVLLKDDGTWSYADAASGAASAASAPAYTGPQAELTLLRRSERPRGCNFALRLENLLPYEIRGLVPYFSAVRADGVVFDTLSVGFISMRPGEARERELDFSGIACSQIATLKVVGGDRCSMGDLETFSSAKGACLERVKVLPSSIMRFEK